MYDKNMFTWKALPGGANLPASGRGAVVGSKKNLLWSSDSTVEYYESSNHRWWKVPAMKEARSACAFVSGQDSALAIGGLSAKDGSYLSSAEVWKETTKQWTSLPPPMNIPRAYPMALSTESLLWVGGGRDDEWNDLASCEIYHWDSQEWEDAPPMSVPRMGGTVVEIPDLNSLLVLGGYDGTEWQDSMEIYDMSSKYWTVLATRLPHSLRFPQAVLLEEHYVVVLGMNVAVEQPTLCILNLETLDWIHPSSTQDVSSLRRHYRDGCSVLTRSKTELVILGPGVAGERRSAMVATFHVDQLISPTKEDVDDTASASAMSLDTTSTRGSSAIIPPDTFHSLNPNHAQSILTSPPTKPKKVDVSLLLLSPHGDAPSIPSTVSLTCTEASAPHPMGGNVGSNHSLCGSLADLGSVISELPFDDGARSTTKVVDLPMVDSKGDVGIYTGDILLSAGNLDDPVPHGVGCMVYPKSGSKYQGSFAHGKRHGQGCMTYGNDGDVYQGGFVRDRKHGYGVCTWADGSCYKGHFFKGKPHDAQGWMCIKASSSSKQKIKEDTKDAFAFYQGAFCKGIRTGQGSLQLANGDVYQGAFEAGRFQGFGVMDYANGRRYEGYWKRGRAHGEGRLLVAENGTILFHGRWKKDTPIPGEGHRCRRTPCLQVESCSN